MHFDQIPFACTSQHQAAGRTVEQSNPEFGLQIMYLARNCGLRNVQAIRCHAHAAVLGNRGEVT